MRKIITALLINGVPIIFWLLIHLGLFFIFYIDYLSGEAFASAMIEPLIAYLFILFYSYIRSDHDSDIKNLFAKFQKLIIITLSTTAIGFLLIGIIELSYLSILLSRNEIDLAANSQLKSLGIDGILFGLIFGFFVFFLYILKKVTLCTLKKKSN